MSTVQHTGEDYISADYEPALTWSERAIADYRNALRPRYPYIDEATPQEVASFVLQLLDEEGEE